MLSKANITDEMMRGCMARKTLEIDVPFYRFGGSYPGPPFALMAEVVPISRLRMLS